MFAFPIRDFCLSFVYGVRMCHVCCDVIDQYVLENAGDDDLMTKNVTSQEEGTIQRLSERHVAVIIATSSSLILVLLIIGVIIFIRHRRCECIVYSQPTHLVIFSTFTIIIKIIIIGVEVARCGAT